MIKNKVTPNSLGDNSAEILKNWIKEAASDVSRRYVIAGRVNDGLTFCVVDSGKGLEFSVRLDASGDVTRPTTPDEKATAIEALNAGRMLIDKFDRVKGKYQCLHDANGTTLRKAPTELAV